MSNLKRFVTIELLALSLLLIPYLAMIVTNEVNWNSFDFLIAGILLATTGLLIEMSMRYLTTQKSKMIAIVTILLFLFLIWAELAVGIFGTPFAGN